MISRAATVLVLMASTGSCELLVPPLMKRVGESNAIAVVTVRKVQVVEPHRMGKYQIVSCDVEKMLKGNVDHSAGSYGGKKVEVSFVATQDSGDPNDESQSCNYVKGGKYIVFLRCSGAKELYNRTHDYIREETYTPELERKVADLVERQKRGLLASTADHVRYEIPKQAVEKPVKLDPDDGQWWARAVEYFVDGRQAGLRAWDKAGRLLYEFPMRDGLEHGRCTRWDSDGRWYLQFFLDGAAHGPGAGHDGKKFEFFYYVRGRYVERAEYEAASLGDSTLLSPLQEEVVRKIMESQRRAGSAPGGKKR